MVWEENGRDPTLDCSGTDISVYLCPRDVFLWIHRIYWLPRKSKWLLTERRQWEGDRWQEDSSGGYQTSQSFQPFNSKSKHISSLQPKWSGVQKEHNTCCHEKWQDWDKVRLAILGDMKKNTTWRYYGYGSVWEEWKKKDLKTETTHTLNFVHGNNNDIFTIQCPILNKGSNNGELSGTLSLKIVMTNADTLDLDWESRIPPNPIYLYPFSRHGYWVHLSSLVFSIYLSSTNFLLRSGRWK